MVPQARVRTPIAGQADTEALVTHPTFLVKAGGQACPSSTKYKLHPFSVGEQRTVLRSLQSANGSGPQNETNLRQRWYMRGEQQQCTSNKLSNKYTLHRRNKAFWKTPLFSVSANRYMQVKMYHSHYSQMHMYTHWPHRTLHSLSLQ